MNSVQSFDFTVFSLDVGRVSPGVWNGEAVYRDLSLKLYPFEASGWSFGGTVLWPQCRF